MKKKDFELIADVIRDSNLAWLCAGGSGATGQKYKQRIAEVFADVLKLVNPRFDRERFLKACGVSSCSNCEKFEDK